MFNVGLPELIVIFLAIFLLFGPTALPEIAKSFGSFLRNIKKDLDGDIADKTKPPAPPQDKQPKP